jgi:cellulose biosynthesis protein BcsQ
MCKIITFYSFKGGVGRSFLLANVAARLATKGRRVLCVDWDLEAPGLGDYFMSRMTESETDAPGLTQLCHSAGSDEKIDWRSAVRKVSFGKTSLDFIPAGNAQNLRSRDYTNGYSSSLSKIDWDSLYNDHGFAETLNKWREEWKKHYDLVLIDSRTGLADTVGICTIHLPDQLVMVFSANEQSVNGGCSVLKKAVQARTNFRYNPGLPDIIPILSRLDQQAEDELSKEWLRKIRDRTQELFQSWFPLSVSLEEYFGTFKVPYFPRWAFGEEIPVLDENETGTDSQTISYYLHRISNLLDGNVTDNLLEIAGGAAPEPVSTGRTARLILVHCKETLEYEDRAQVVKELLVKEGVEADLLSRASTRIDVQERLEHADAILILLSPGLLKNTPAWDFDSEDGFTLGEKGMRTLAKIRPVATCSILKTNRLTSNSAMAKLRMRMDESDLYPYLKGDNRQVAEISPHFDSSSATWIKDVANWAKQKATARS